MVACGLFYDTATYMGAAPPPDGGTVREPGADRSPKNDAPRPAADASDGMAPSLPTVLAVGEEPRGIVEAGGSIYWVSGGADHWNGCGGRCRDDLFATKRRVRALQQRLELWK